ncbi:MAG: peptidoglycan DD-metalloendopeptidase family protein [Dehalococcoidia bacterium]
MRIGAAAPADPLTSPAPAATPSPGASPVADFAVALQRHLGEPRAALQEVRAAIQSLRYGGGRRSYGADRVVPRVGMPLAGRDGALLPYSPTGPTSDPFGWRALSRQLGDELVSPGFGAIFERQIQQESGFSPEVAFGLRRSSAGAEGIAQLMPEYYPGVKRDDPQEALVAGARTMRHYLEVFEGDVRPALAAYNAGLGRVQTLMANHGADWERALPQETKGYLAAIVGDARPRVQLDSAEVAIFGGRGPGGVLIVPVDRLLAEAMSDGLLQLLTPYGATVRAPADGQVSAVQRGENGTTLTIDHGNGWQSSLQGIGELALAVGDNVRRGQPLGLVAHQAGGGQGLLRFGVTLDSRAVDPRPYLLRS